MACLVAAAVILGGCGASSLKTALDVPDTTRHPDGVVVEPPPAIPPAEERASAQAGVVALRQPISDEQIGELVHRYIRAFVTGDSSALEDLVDPNAVLFGDSGRSAPRIALMRTLEARYRQHASEYGQLRGDVAHVERMERWTFDDLGPFTDPPRPAEMREGDVYARIPLDPRSSSAGDPLFRTTLVLLVRRGADHVLRIAGLEETDTP